MRQATTSEVLKEVQRLLRDDTRSTYQIAELSKISQPTVFKIKNARSTNPGIETIERLYAVLTGKKLHVKG